MTTKLITSAHTAMFQCATVGQLLADGQPQTHPKELMMTKSTPNPLIRKTLCCGTRPCDWNSGRVHHAIT